jgi:hypothetical protein
MSRVRHKAKCRVRETHCNVGSIPSMSADVLTTGAYKGLTNAPGDNSVCCQTAGNNIRSLGFVIMCKLIRDACNDLL